MSFLASLLARFLRPMAAVLLAARQQQQKQGLRFFPDVPMWLRLPPYGSITSPHCSAAAPTP